MLPTRQLLAKNPENIEAEELFLHVLKQNWGERCFGVPLPPIARLYERQEEIFPLKDKERLDHVCHGRGYFSPAEAMTRACNLASYDPGPHIADSVFMQAKFISSGKVFVCSRSGKVHTCDAACEGDSENADNQRVCTVSGLVVPYGEKYAGDMEAKGRQRRTADDEGQMGDEGAIAETGDVGGAEETEDAGADGYGRGGEADGDAEDELSEGDAMEEDAAAEDENEDDEGFDAEEEDVAEEAEYGDDYFSADSGYGGEEPESVDAKVKQEDAPPPEEHGDGDELDGVIPATAFVTGQQLRHAPSTAAQSATAPAAVNKKALFLAKIEVGTDDRAPSMNIATGRAALSGRAAAPDFFKADKDRRKQEIVARSMSAVLTEYSAQRASDALFSGNKTVDQWMKTAKQDVERAKQTAEQEFEDQAAQAVVKRRNVQEEHDPTGAASENRIQQWISKSMASGLFKIIPPAKVAASVREVVADLLTGTEAREMRRTAALDEEKKTHRAVHKYLAQYEDGQPLSGQTPTLPQMMAVAAELRGRFMWSFPEDADGVNWKEAEDYYTHLVLRMWHIVGPFATVEASKPRGPSGGVSNSLSNAPMRFAVGLLYYVRRAPYTFNVGASSSAAKGMGNARSRARQMDVLVEEPFLARHMVRETQLARLQAGAKRYPQKWIFTQVNVFELALKAACERYNEAHRLPELDYAATAEWIANATRAH